MVTVLCVDSSIVALWLWKTLSHTLCWLNLWSCCSYCQEITFSASSVTKGAAALLHQWPGIWPLCRCLLPNKSRKLSTTPADGCGLFCYLIILQSALKGRDEHWRWHCFVTWPDAHWAESVQHCRYIVIVMSTITHMNYYRGSHVLFCDYMAGSKVCTYTVSKINVWPDFLCFTLWTTTTSEMHMPPRLPLLLLLQQRLFVLPRG